MEKEATIFWKLNEFFFRLLREGEEEEVKDEEEKKYIYI